MPSWTAKVALIRLRTNVSLIVISLRYWQTRTHCCGHSVAHDVSWAVQTGKHLFRTQTVSDQNQKHFLCPGHKICVPRSNGDRKHLCRQQCVRNNVSSLARAFRSRYVTSILIAKLTFAMFLLKLSTLSAAIFLFVSLVLSLLCV